MPNNEVDSTLVIGLGRFGSAVAVTLDNLNREILAVDVSSKLVQKWSSRIPTLEADMTNMAALEQIGAADFSSAVVGVGSSLEASVLITANLVDIGVPQIWAKATSREHGRILKRIGAHHVIYPEFDAGQRTAHLVSGRMLDYIEMERNGFSIVKMRPPREFWGFTLEEAQVRRKYGVTVIGVLSVGQPFEYASANTRIHEDDIIIVGGDPDLLEQFAYHS